MNRIERLLITGGLVLISLGVSAQELVNNSTVDSSSLWKKLAYDGASVFGGVKHAYTSPFRWEKDDFVTLGAVTAGTVLLHLIDEEGNEYFTNQAAGVPQGIRDLGFYFGKPLYNYGFTGSVYALGLITKNDDIRRTGVLLISSATASGVLQTVLKTVAGRARPVAGEGALTFDPFNKEAAFHSFPSGHAMLSFTTAYAIGKQFENPLVRYSIYAAGMITPVSRLWAGAHWVTDVALGIAISVAVVDSIDNYLKKEGRYESDRQKPMIQWSLRLGPQKVGLVGTF